ncbi:pseudouridine synthase [Plebeiibacterium marinum]|uniref:Pseudouridine synthase n=1 Tax=Plebeiibacterium marinum TaxID=2992111 RepID=A0AAE3MCQ2_9BACT|nr:pseudouridine synthase [Plebeiobacterium marinum]MCW3805421.1 rRNA pseudouridine synthase [Plebeiobacterium marinum]
MNDKSQKKHRKGRPFQSKKQTAIKENIPTPPSQTKEKDQIRLNKFIANAGVCSRREADRLIAEGLIKVNGEVVTLVGSMVKLNDEVIYEGKVLNAEKLVYVLLNKPKDCVTTLSDPHAKRTVIDIVKNACTERIYPVGRLDKMTTGVLLLTNDGDLAKRLTHPSHEHRKIYHAFLDKPISKEDLKKIETGFELEDGFIKSDKLSLVKENPLEVGIEIHSGKNRIVRRIFKHLGYEVIKLDRVYFSGLTKKDVPRGKWRFLTQKEITFLKAGIMK